MTVEIVSGCLNLPMRAFACVEDIQINGNKLVLTIEYTAYSIRVQIDIAADTKIKIYKD